MEILENLDLLSVGLVVAAMVVLGFSVYFSNRKSISNETFLYFTIVTALWGSINYAFYNITNIDIALWFLRLVLFFAVWQAYALFVFFYVFPKKEINFPGWCKFILFPLVLVTSIFTLTPLVLKEVSTVVEGRIIGVINGPFMPIFGIVASILVFAAIFILLRKLRNTDKTEKQPLQLILLGALMMFSLIIIFNLVLPVLADNSRFIPLGALFIFPFVLLTSVAILKHKLFDIKVAGIGLLVFALSVTAFGEVIFADNLPIVIYRSSVFVLILIFGILLIKGVLREVSLREQLQEANKAQENLIHFITHQIKGFLTKSRNIFAELAEGTFGPISPEVKKISEQGLQIGTDAVSTVQTILNAANIKTGKITYDIKPINLREIVEQVFEKQKKNAESRGIDLSLTVNPDQSFEFKGDSTQLSEAFSNLIDNSIKYTPEGSIKVSLDKIGNAINFKVKDTGIGIAKEDIGKLFQEGGRATNAQKVNVDSTGFGLYIVKNIIEAHGGRVWVESAGQGKGSEFIVELPVG